MDWMNKVRPSMVAPVEQEEPPKEQRPVPDFRINVVTVDSIPPVRARFVMNEQTRRLIVRFSGMPPGTTVRFTPEASGTLTAAMALRRLKSRASTAAKHAKGRFEIVVRDGSVYVSRLREA